MSRSGIYDLKYGFIPDDDMPQEQPKQTNADRIRSMTDEELAEFITARHYTPHCPVPQCEADETTDCEQCWLGWLRKETQKRV